MSGFAGSDFIDTMLAEPAAEVPIAVSPAECEFTIKKFALAALLDKAASVVPSKAVQPVLTNFQVDAAPGRLRVIATDLELSVIATTVLVDVARAGVVVLPARKLADIVRESQDGDVRINVTAGTAAIAIGPTTWKVKLHNGADYPQMPEVSQVAFTPVDRQRFAAALHAVRYAACKESTRASLMMINVKDGKFTACDGARFQQAAVADLNLDMQIPIGAVDNLLKLIRGCEGTIGVASADNHLVFAFGPDVFIVNRLMANFPNMEQLLLRPALENTYELTVDRAELLHAVKRTRINADAETSAIGLTLAPGTLTVSARDKYSNTATETIDAGWDHPPRTVVVNHQFLTDMLAGYGQPSCSFWLGDDTKTRKAPLMLKDPDAGTVGVVQQMLGEWVGA